MTEEERRRCCLLGGCGCSPGGAEQRAAMRAWLLEKLGLSGEIKASRPLTEGDVDVWLDELFAGAESA